MGCSASTQIIVPDSAKVPTDELVHPKRRRGQRKPSDKDDIPQCSSKAWVNGEEGKALKEKHKDPSMPGMFFYVNKDTGEMQREEPEEYTRSRHGTVVLSKGLKGLEEELKALHGDDVDDKKRKRKGWTASQ